MPPKRPVSPLYQRCILSLENMLFDVCQKHYRKDGRLLHLEKDERVCAVRKCLSDNLAGAIRNDFLDSVLKKVRKGGFRFRADSKVVESSGYLLMQMLFLLGGKGLAELDFQTEKVGSKSDAAISYCRTAFLGIVIPDVCWANSLVILELPFVVTPDIIRQISLLCHNLEVLNIKSWVGSCDPDPMVTNLSWLYGQYPSASATLSDPRGCPKLKELELSEYLDDKEVIDHVVNMMKYMPGLHVVRNVDTKFIVLEYMESVSDCDSIKFTEYEDWDIYDIQGYTVADKLPFVKCCRKVGGYYADLLADIIQIFNDLPYLTKLELTFNRVESLLDTRICVLSPYLVELVLDVDYVDITTENVVVFSRMFPNLEILCFDTCMFKGIPESDVIFHGHFKKLKSLELRSVAEIDSHFLLKFLMECSELHSLKISLKEVNGPYDYDDETELTDEVIDVLVGHMGNLEKVYFAREHSTYSQIRYPICLTKVSALNILQSCPNLKTLGDLNTWNISEAEVMEIMSTVKSRNWDVNLDDDMQKSVNILKSFNGLT